MTLLRPIARLALALLALSAPTRVAAQRVLGPTPEAVTIPGGMLRTTLLAENLLHRGWWSDGVGQGPSAGLYTPSFGARENFWLSELDTRVAALGGGSGASSLGVMDADVRQRLSVTRLGLEYGIADWLTLSVDAPFVRARAEAQVRLRGDGATVGVNPASFGTGVLDANRNTILGYQDAAAQLTQRRDDCVGNAGAHPECGDILNELAAVNTLIASLQAFAVTAADVYGATGFAPGLPFAPLEGAGIATTLQTRVDSMAAAYTRYGVPALIDATLPLGAQFPLSAAQLEALVADSTNGYGAKPLSSFARQNLGDVDIGLRFRLLDTFGTEFERLGANRVGVRQTVGVTYRLGGGVQDLPDNFIDLGTGSGHDALALRSYTDVILNEKFWATVTVGWAKGAEHQRLLRVPSVAGTQWLEVWRTAPVTVTPGGVLDLRVAPRFTINDYFGIGAEWRWRTKSEDQHSVGAPLVAGPSGAPALNAAALDAGSAWNEQRLAWTISYSTLAATARGKARLPFEIAYTHEQSVASSGGFLPRQTRDHVQLRFYTQLFGR